MRVDQLMLASGMVLSRSEAQRLIKGGAVFMGGCVGPCNARRFQCPSFAGNNCDLWLRVTDPTTEAIPGEVIRIGRGNYRLVQIQGSGQLAQLPGVCYIPINP